MANLKDLSSKLDVCEGFLKGLIKGNKKGKEDFISVNTANACRAVAQFTGYKNVTNAEKAIRATVNKFFVASEKYALRLLKISSGYGEKRKATIEKAAEALMTNNYTQFKKILKRDEKLWQGFGRITSKTIKSDLIEKLRKSGKNDATTAKRILTQAGSPHGYKIVVPQSKIEAEVQKRLKRYGAIASLFWHSAKSINPSIKPKNLSKEKRKKHKLTNGMSYKTATSSKEVTASINHRAEKLNSKFKSKLLTTIAKQEKFWAQRAEKEIIAAGVIDKLLDKL